jgi:DedD protein
MEEKNELNDIILNKSSKRSSARKVLLAVATFSIVVIIIVIIMNRFNGSQEIALPHAPEVTQAPIEEVLPEPDYQSAASADEKSDVEPGHMAERAEIESVSPENVPGEQGPLIEEEVQNEMPFKEPEYATKPSAKTVEKPASKPAARVTRSEAKPTVIAPKTRPFGKYDPKSKRVVDVEDVKTAEIGHYYIQVGSFAKYSPSKTFLNKIADRGYTYTFHKVNQNGRTLTKVLVGPFKTQSSAREALPIIKKSVISTAFLVKL